MFLLDAALYRPPSLPAVQPPAGVEEADRRAPAEPRAFSHYAEKMGRRLFQGERWSVSGGPEASPAGMVMVEGDVSHLELQGVFMDADPQALVVDRRTSRSYRVKEGQAIGPIQVRKIQKDGLILFYEGQTLKLSL
ncbi:MAG: hypothetical protein A3F84_06435 [Candidatus Handelsmanbacteria bacterium RIFCSPLOWO2_12_FULL_64_10]|uniref:Type II secretion system protein GspC N-terminal domain-containing protein n=1 Tax=Handelsmanbacteria sp. (strain RIFCSPLOWO2_12_FULL_64_10) TaxID=1817868 RepID=A0A1F6CQY2_HANXR|nr:MAG: hypothetical protein A3F84_06435 [Candidatus Handelsmanbacteria bacterium RIFCSPLOWO2_12_FULL_64_10]